MENTMVIRIASLFSGIGGFELGITRASNTTGIDTETIFSSEIDKFARQTYLKNFGVEPHGDITQIEAANIPDHDILCGGFPCQSFSIAGKRRGFEDTRGTLFFEIARILERKQPRMFFLENVRGLLSHDKGKTFAKILQTVDELGYDAEWQLFNSKNFGVPQNRERVFIIGHLRGSGTRAIFPITKNGERIDKTQKTSSRKRKWVQSNDISNCVNTRFGSTARGQQLIAGCLTGGGHSGGLHSDMTTIKNTRGIRRLTPIECERLQGFPQYESYISVNIHNNIICLDHQKSYVNAEMKNHRLQKRVLNVENGRLQENVKYVDENSVQSYQPTKKHVRKNVHINCVESIVEIHNQKKSSSFANFVESQNSYHQHIKTEDFVQMLVGINTMYEKIITFGKEELHQKGQFSIHQKNGKTFVKLFGSETMLPAPDAEIDLITLKKHLKCITLNHSSSNCLDLNSIISFFYVMTVITGCIQTKTEIKDSLNLDIHSVFGYTYGISDTQRYKCLGNAVTVNVIEFIMERLLKNVRGVN